MSIAEHDIVLINFNTILNSAETDLIDDLHFFKLLDKPLNRPDTVKLFYYHIILKVCETLLRAKKHSKPIIAFNSQISCTLQQYFQTEELLAFIQSFIKELEQLLPVKIYRCCISNEAMKTLETGHLHPLTINALIRIKDSPIKSYTFERVKKFAKKYELTFLSEDYFNQIKTKQILLH